MDASTTLEITLFIATLLTMIVGLVGALIPILPGAWLIWLAALGYGLGRWLFLGQPAFDGWIGGIAMVFLTILAVIEIGLEFVVTHSVAKKSGVSWQALVASFVLGLVALPFYPPIGPLLGSVGGLFLVEYLRHGKDWRKAWAGVKGYATGCGWSVLAELGLCVLMILIWLVWVVVALAV